MSWTTHSTVPSGWWQAGRVVRRSSLPASACAISRVCHQPRVPSAGSGGCTPCGTHAAVVGPLHFLVHVRVATEQPAVVLCEPTDRGNLVVGEFETEHIEVLPLPLTRPRLGDRQRTEL